MPSVKSWTMPSVPREVSERPDNLVGVLTCLRTLAEETGRTCSCHGGTGTAKRRRVLGRLKE